MQISAYRRDAFSEKNLFFSSDFYNPFCNFVAN